MLSTFINFKGLEETRKYNQTIKDIISAIDNVRNADIIKLLIEQSFNPPTQTQFLKLQNKFNPSFCLKCKHGINMSVILVDIRLLCIQALIHLRRNYNTESCSSNIEYNISKLLSKVLILIHGKHHLGIRNA